MAPPLTGGDRGVGQWVLSQNASVNLFAQFSLEPRPEALHVGVQTALLLRVACGFAEAPRCWSALPLPSA